MDRATLLFGSILMILFHCSFAKSNLSKKDEKRAEIAEMIKQIEEETNNLISFMDHLRNEFVKVQAPNSTDFYVEGDFYEKLIDEIELREKELFVTIENLKQVDKEIRNVRNSVGESVMLKFTTASTELMCLATEMSDISSQLKYMRDERKYGETKEMRLVRLINQVEEVQAEITRLSVERSSKSKIKELREELKWLNGQIIEIKNNLIEDLSAMSLTANFEDKHGSQETSEQEDNITKLIGELSLIQGSSSQEPSPQESSSQRSFSSKSKGKGKRYN